MDFLIKILAFVLLIVISGILGIIVAWWIAMTERGESLGMGFGKDEVDEDLGTGKGIVHYITRE